MLYDPKWEDETKGDPLQLESLIAWLEKQSAEREYCYMDNGCCLLGQYFTAMGMRGVEVGGTTLSHSGGHNILLSDAFSDIAVGRPRTFGAALNRARKLAVPS